jgi:hypothetical protein
MAPNTLNVVEVEADPEIEAMARVWIQEHWGMRWPEDVAAEVQPEVRRLIAALRRALDDVREANRRVA